LIVQDTIVRKTLHQSES